MKKPGITVALILLGVIGALILVSCVQRAREPAPAPAYAPAPPPPPPPPPAPPPPPEIDAAERARQEAEYRARVERGAAARAARQGDAARREAEARAPEALIKANPNVARDEQFDRVRVFFATDRRATDNEGRFGGERGEALQYGSVSVSIPRTHKPGEIERPPVWQLEIDHNPREHMVLVSREVTDREQFFAGIRETLARGGSKASFVFIHGFNVGFDDAARRTAQITYDLDFPGAPVFYSWPSQGKEDAYLVDDQNVEWTEPHLRGFLRDYAAKSEAESIYLIAHSLGARALAQALATLFTEEPALRSRFKDIILTAPDIDADTFKVDLAPKLASGTGKVTLYVSSMDKALRAAKQFTDKPKAGDAGRSVAVVKGIETVDASAVDTSFIERAYAEQISVLSDIRRVVVDGVRAVDRGLERYEAEGGSFWRLDAVPPRRTGLRNKADGSLLLVA
jgi:esterase/lipase superfamily enzyme